MVKKFENDTTSRICRHYNNYNYCGKPNNLYQTIVRLNVYILKSKTQVNYIHCLLYAVQLIANKVVGQELWVLLLVKLTERRLDDGSARLDGDAPSGLDADRSAAEKFGTYGGFKT